MHQKIKELVMVLGKDDSISSLAKIGREKGTKICLVGGFIRDSLLGKMPVDMDFVIEECAEAISRKFAKSVRGKFIILGREPKISYRVAVRGEIIDFINAYGNDLKKDLFKRDFTINSVALDINSWQVLDPFNGIGDIDNRIIREVSSESLKDDPLRVVRAIRYASTTDGMTIEETTYCHMKDESKNIVNCAFERFAEEINKMFGSFNPAEGLKLIIETQVIEHILRSSITDTTGHKLSIGIAEDIEEKFAKEISTKIIKSLRKSEYQELVPLSDNHKALWISALLIIYMNKLGFLPSDVKPILRHMKFSGKDIARIYHIISGTIELFKIFSQDYTDDTLKLFIGHNGKDFVLMQALYEGFSDFQREDGRDSENMIREMCELFIENRDVLLSSQQLVTGDDVKKILKVVESGEKIGFILRKISDLRFTGVIKNRDDALQYIRSYQDD